LDHFGLIQILVIIIVLVVESFGSLWTNPNLSYFSVLPILYSFKILFYVLSNMSDFII